MLNLANQSGALYLINDNRINTQFIESGTNDGQKVTGIFQTKQLRQEATEITVT